METDRSEKGRYSSMSSGRSGVIIDDNRVANYKKNLSNHNKFSARENSIDIHRKNERLFNRL